jgi:sigma-B regulation protein RsbU (phosphoserine phosphatase)
MGDVEYVETEHRLAAGDRVLFYSDGLTEVFGPEDEMFGDERMVDVLGETRSVPLGDLPNALAEFVLGWSGTESFEDDLSILVLESRS